MHAADVKQVLRAFAIEVPAREKDDLKEEPIVVKLRKVRYSSIPYLPNVIAYAVLFTRRAEQVTMASKLSLAATL